MKHRFALFYFAYRSYRLADEVVIPWSMPNVTEYVSPPDIYRIVGWLKLLCCGLRDKEDQCRFSEISLPASHLTKEYHYILHKNSHFLANSIINIGVSGRLTADSNVNAYR